MPRSPFLVSTYSSDEDIYNAAPGDFGALIPSTNLLAAGHDGVFASGSPWTLSSASNDFTAQGVAPGMVVQLKGGGANAFKVPQYLAVDSVTGPSAVLRRCGFAAGQGLPPSPAAGLTGVEFRVLSLYPQIEDAAYELDQRYAVDPLMPNRNPASIQDQRVFRRLTALWVLVQLYTSESRTKDGDWAAKVEHYQTLYDAALETAAIGWGPLGQLAPPTNPFSMQVRR